MSARKPTAARVPPLAMAAFRRVRQVHFGTPMSEQDHVRNVSRLWAYSPGLMVAQRPYQNYLRHGTSLPRRDQELAILRICWRSEAQYAVTQHYDYGRQAGLSEPEMAVAASAVLPSDWPSHEQALLLAVDELHADDVIGEETWTLLAEHYSVAQLLDLISLIGRYWTVSVMVNSLGVPLEDGDQGPN